MPFTDLTLKLNGGDKSILQNPSDCGPHEGAAHLVGWSGDTKDLTPTVDVTNCNDDPPFQPSVSAHADDESAGASSPSHLGVDRPDGDARMTKLAAGAAGRPGRKPQDGAALPGRRRARREPAPTTPRSAR